jgi:hypothetical protein
VLILSSHLHLFSQVIPFLEVLQPIFRMCFSVSQMHATVESRLCDLQSADIPFYPTCHVGMLHFNNSDSEGLNSIETVLAYVEQQREATATDVLLFRRWHDLATKKRKEFRSKYPLLISKKINTFIYKFTLC